MRNRLLKVAARIGRRRRERRLIDEIKSTMVEEQRQVMDQMISELEEKLVERRERGK